MHLDRLHALCRVCGERSRKRQSDTKYSQSYIALCRHVAPDLLKFHKIYILFDTPDVHSWTLCCKYYARIKKLKFSENPSSTTIQNAQSDIEKASFLWKEFDPSLKSEQCTVCSKFSQQCKGGRPITKKKKRTQHAPKDCDRSELEMSTSVPQAVSTPQKMTLSVETQTASTVPSTSAADKSTPDRSQPKTVEIQTSPPAKCLMDTATSPFPAKTKQLRSPRKLSTPLTREEEEYHTKLTKLKMNESGDKSTVRCKMKGQPLVFKKVTVPRKPSLSAASPTRSKRARMMENIRLEVSGSTAEDEMKQHSTEI